MTRDEIEVRSSYLLLACSQAIEHLHDHLVAVLPSSVVPSNPLLQRTLRRELGLIFRYWVTKQIWDRAELVEADARQLNLVLLRLFTEAFHLPRDGSGLRYAELSSFEEEARELSRRIVHAAPGAPQSFLAELRGALSRCQETVRRQTADALDLPTGRLTASVTAWMESKSEKRSKSKP